MLASEFIQKLKTLKELHGDLQIENDIGDTVDVEYYHDEDGTVFVVS